jgi:hypothetical protein
MSRNTVSRSLHDVGLAAWFGGTLANAVALNPAAAESDSPERTGAVANVGWDRWTPVNAGAIGLHLLGGAGLVGGNASRLAGQKGVASMAVTKTALTAAALAVTAYSRMLGRKVSDRTDVPAESGTDPAPTTPDDVATAQRQLRMLQWAVPALTGTLLVLNSLAGEQQRPQSVARGVVDRFTPGH